MNVTMENCNLNDNAMPVAEARRRRMEALLRGGDEVFADCRVGMGETPLTVTDDQRRKGRTEMAQRLMTLLNVRDRDNYYWVGSQTDLVELAYDAWLEGLVRDTAGNPVSFLVIARRVCAKLHMPLPSNVYVAARRARNRKGIRHNTLLDRYCYLRFVRGKADPIGEELLRLSV